MMSCSARLAKIWLKEPLLHFMFLGVMLFAAYQWFGNRAEDPAKATREISISQGRIHSLTETFARLWNRSPTQEELDGLIRDYVREEVMYREALALGLDRDDAIVRRRLQQKLEFLSDDLAMTGEPTEQELDEFLTQHPESFRRETRLTFSQVFLNPERRGASLEADTTQLLAKLNAQSSTLDLISLSDSRMLDPRLDEASQSEVQEKIYDLVWSGDRKLSADGKLPVVGNTVDVANATWTNTIGDPELITVWKDPSFDAAQRAFYYARVIEIPIPRWTAYDAKKFGLTLPKEVPMTTTERAYTSPIWYTPGKEQQ